MDVSIESSRTTFAMPLAL